MNFIVDNWAIIIAALAVLGTAVMFVINFFQKPTPEQLRQVREWLLFAVTEAEKALGSGTGKLKLRYVYDMFITKFEFISKLISFDKFSELVDQALEEMKKLLESNKSVQAYVGVETSEVKEDSKEELKEEK